MRSLTTAFLTFNISGGFFRAAGIGPLRALSDKTTAKTATAKTV